MSANEIEIAGSAFTVRCLAFKVDSLEELLKKIRDEADQFSIDPEKPGFHDYEMETAW